MVMMTLSWSLLDRPHSISLNLQLSSKEKDGKDPGCAGIQTLSLVKASHRLCRRHCKAWFAIPCCQLTDGDQSAICQENISKFHS